MGDVKCPRCGLVAEHETCLRQGKIGDKTVVDVGWKCRRCGCEWGFDLFKKVCLGVIF